jgi:hypothetical protein
MSSNYHTAVNAFLNQLGLVRFGNLNRIWQAFMAYSMCIIAEAFRSRGYRITPMNHPSGFRFKCFPRGDPNDYSYFHVRKDEESFEIRLSIDAQNLSWKSIRLNLDVVVIPENSIDLNNVVDSGQSLITFAECKNMRGFPELVATFEGMVYELQRTRLYRNSVSGFRIPACLLLTESGRSILYVDNRYQNRNVSMRIFDFLQPGHSNIQTFIQTWF